MINALATVIFLAVLFVVGIFTFQDDDWKRK